LGHVLPTKLRRGVVATIARGLARVVAGCPPLSRCALEALLVALLITLHLAPSSKLIAQTWDGGSTNNNWTSANNWNPNVLPVNNGTANLTFAGTTRLTPNQDVPYDVSSVIFDPAAGAFVLQGANSLTIRGGGITSNASVAETINNNLVLGANQTWTVTNPASTLTAAGVVSGAGSLNKDGSGTLVLSGTNTYTGGTTVTAGILRGTTASLPGAITNNANVTFNQTTSGTYAGVMSGTGNLVKSGTGTATLSGANTYSGGTTVSAGSLAGTTNSLQGAVVNNANVTFNQTTSGTYAGVMSGTGNLVKSGTGTVTLSGANTYSGGTTVSAGRLSGTTSSIQRNVANSGTVEFDQTTNGTYTGVMSGTGNLVKSGSGAVTLSGANTYSGGTTVSAGSLAGTTTSLQGAITNNANVTFSQSSSGTYSGAMSGTGNLVKSGTGTVTLSGANTYSGGTTVSAGSLVGTTTSLQGAITNNANVTFNQTTSGTYAGVMSGTGILVKSGTGAVTLSGANTYSGGTTVSAGSLRGDTNSLQGAITNNANITFDQAADGTYSGNMSGSGSLTKTNSGNLTLGGVNSYSGGTSIDNGTLTGDANSLRGNISNNAALVFDEAGDGNFAGAISGTGTLTKKGSGSLNLTGNSALAGPITIQQGRLAVNGSLAGNVSVEQGAVLGGNGTITGNVSNFGTIAPGNSIGTNVINGSFDNGADATVAVEINNGGATPGVNNDLTVVNGPATVAGGTVEVTADSGDYQDSTRYTFLAATSISGQFNRITLNNLPGMHATLGYGSMLIGSNDFATAFFMLLRDQTNLAAIAETFNELQVANYLDSAALGAGSELRTLLDEIVVLPADEQQTALNELTAQVNGTLAQLCVQNTTFLYSMLRRRVGSSLSNGCGDREDGPGWLSANRTDERTASSALVGYRRRLDAARMRARLDRDRSPGWGGWTAGYGFGGNAEGDGNASGGVYGSGGTLVAIERQLADNALWGVFGAYSNLSLRLKGLPQSALANQGLFGSYFLRDAGSTYLLTAGAIGFTGFSEQRQIAFGTINSRASAKYNGWQPSAYIESGLRWQFGRAMLQPYGALQYIYLRQNGFSESGAGLLNQSVGGIDTHSLRGLLGSRIARPWVTNSGRVFVPELRAGWIHEFLSPETTLNAVFTPVGGASYATRGLNFGRDWALLGGGFQCSLSSHVSLFANYDLQLNARQVWSAGSGGLQFAW